MPGTETISLVIPVFNEEQSVGALLQSISDQSLQPDEIILVDAGSKDRTVEVIKDRVGKDSRFRVVEAGRAMPGRARNVGVEAATSEWIAFTDAGITLDRNWLSELKRAAGQDNSASIIYGNYRPFINSGFEKWATIAYVSPAQPGSIRGKFIASSMMKKQVWEKTGGFPDWRAAEDLIFMENAEKLGFKFVNAPSAMVNWQLRPGPGSTYKRFTLYSKYNVWAKRQAYWHYGVARQYALVLVFIALGIFHHWFWFLLIPAWLLARTAKRIYAHRFEFGLKELFNPLTIFGVMLITVIIDIATFSGWANALVSKSTLEISTS